MLVRRKVGATMPGSKGMVYGDWIEAISLTLERFRAVVSEPSAALWTGLVYRSLQSTNDIKYGVENPLDGLTDAFLPLTAEFSFDAIHTFLDANFRDATEIQQLLRSGVDVDLAVQLRSA
jgi:hypothetical protein